MGDKVYTLVLHVDLNCCRCQKKIQEYLCSIRHQENIVEIVYDNKKDEVRIFGPLNCLEQLKGKLICKFHKTKIIKFIEIIPPKQQPKPPEPPKEDPLKKKFMQKCMEEYEEVKKCIEKCKAECEEKCMEKFKCKCKSKCDCDCKKEKPPEPPKPKPEPAKPEPPKLPPCPQRPLPCLPEFTVCCTRPCPCFVAWANNFQCCSCGVVCWPKWSGPGWGPGPGIMHPPQWGYEPSHPPRGYDPCQPPNVYIESSPPCSIM